MGRDVGSGDLGHGALDPEGRRAPPDPAASRLRGSTTNPVDPDAGVEDGPDVVGDVEPERLGRLRAQVARPRRPGRRVAASAAWTSAAASAGSRLVNSEPGASTIWSAARDGVGDRRGRRARRAGRARSRRIRSVEFWTATWPSTTPPSTVGLEHDRLRRGRQDPADRAERVDRRSSSAGSQSPVDLGEPDEHEVAERVTVELARARSGARTPAPTASWSTPSSAASATRHLRRSPTPSTPRSRRSRPVEPPSSATLTTAVMSRGVVAHGAQRRREAVPAADGDDARPPAGSVTVDVPVADVGPVAEVAEDARRAPRPSRRCGAGRRCSRCAIDRYALPSRS